MDAAVGPGQEPLAGSRAVAGPEFDESAEEGAYVLGGQPCDFLGAEAWDEVEADAGGVAGVSVFAEPVDGDAAEPVGQVLADGAVCGGDGQAAVAIGDLLGEFVGGVPVVVP